MTDTVFVLRLSTDNKQANNSDLPFNEDSLSTQCDKCNQYIEKNNINTEHSDSINHIINDGVKFNITHEMDKIILTYHSPAYNENSYYFDHFSEVLKILKNHQIIFSKVNRFSRNVKDAIEMLDICKKNNNTLIFIEENLNFSKNTINYAPLIGAIAVAESESKQKSENAKESRKRKKENNSYFNTNGFGNSFKRTWEIYILLLIERLDTIDIHNPLKLEYIQKYMYEIIKEYPITHDEKTNKINFVDEHVIDVKVDNTNFFVLTESQNISEISDLLMDYAISSFTNDHEKLILDKDNYVKELDKMNKLPSMIYRTSDIDETPMSICNNNDLDVSLFLVENNKIFSTEIGRYTKFKKNTELVLYKETNIPVKNTDQKPSFYDLGNIFSNFRFKMMNDSIYKTKVEELEITLKTLCETDDVDEVVDNFHQSSIDENSGQTSIDENSGQSKKKKTDLSNLSDKELGCLFRNFLEKN